MTHFTIYNWMIDELHLKGSELYTFALIHSFSMHDQDFNGSIKYICTRTGITSKTTVINALKSLVDKGCIIKTETGKDERGYTPNFYESNYNKDGKPITKNVLPITKNGIGKEEKSEVNSTKNVPPYTKNCTPPITKNEHNNKLNTEINNEKEIYVDFSENLNELFDYMNTKWKSSYSAQDSHNTENLIEKLKSNKYTIDEFKTMIDYVADNWINSIKLYPYANPTAVFGKDFDTRLYKAKRYYHIDNEY